MKALQNHLVLYPETDVGQYSIHRSISRVTLIV